MSSDSLKSIIYDASVASLRVLDQLVLPAERRYLDVPSTAVAHQLIAQMNIRGAPMIAMVAVLGLAVDLTTGPAAAELGSLETPDAMRQCLADKLEYLGTSRPTAVNLFNAIREVNEKLDQVIADAAENDAAADVRLRLVAAVADHGASMLERDTNDCLAIGQHGADAILKQNDDSSKVCVLTICNTGALACSSHGTALGVVRSLHARDALKQVVALETRPYNQGSRLTAFEIMEDKLPGTLISDSMAAAYFQTHQVDAVVVGADRVCRNGDTANKIGTYALALHAHAHQVPFYVAAPVTTVDLDTAHGDQIPIEQRPPDEFRKSAQAPADVPVWNPGFDVTPAKLIAGVITERGVIPNVQGNIDVPGFLDKESKDNKSKLVVPSDYIEQSAASMPEYLVKHVPKAMAVLDTTEAKNLECVEMGDGNLNLVFIVTNKTKPDKQIIVKQALPYVRCVGESWPLTLERAYFEYTALEAEKAACPEFVPDLYYFNKAHGLICMEYLAPPNIIFRKGLIQGIRYPTIANDLGVFCARTFFKTSGFGLSTTQLREGVEFWSRNSEMCALTEQVVFTEPYMESSNNRWTSPQLDADKAAIEADVELRAAAAGYKAKFLTQTQALIHADLHSGSVMCSPGHTYVIDPEFAFYGPMGFDSGALLANLLLAYVSQAGHTSEHGDADYGAWILEQCATFWRTLVEEFTRLWQDPAEHTGFWFGTIRADEDSTAVRAAFFDQLLQDTLGFAGMKMLRRIVGIAHVEDLDSIADADLRAQCERRGLSIAQHFIKHASTMKSIEDALSFARQA